MLIGIFIDMVWDRIYYNCIFEEYDKNIQSIWNHDEIYSILKITSLFYNLRKVNNIEKISLWFSRSIWNTLIWYCFKYCFLNNVVTSVKRIRPDIFLLLLRLQAKKHIKCVCCCYWHEVLLLLVASKRQTASAINIHVTLVHTIVWIEKREKVFLILWHNSLLSSFCVSE